MNEQEIRNIIRDEISKQSTTSQYTLTAIKYHIHNGIDSPKINPANFMGFPVRTATPTDSPPDGTIVLSNISGTRKIWARINNVWYSATLT